MTATWGDREDHMFYTSGMTVFTALTTPPKGNHYYILSHAYIAAKFNELNASVPAEVSAALDWAFNFFMSYSSNEDFDKDLRNQLTYYADILDQYNNGLIGPGHCSE